MRAARRIAHDLSEGNPAERVARAGIQAERQVKTSRMLRTPCGRIAHSGRALRIEKNLLLERFSAVGVGVAEDDDGSVWVCEIFAEL